MKELNGKRFKRYLMVVVGVIFLLSVTMAFADGKNDSNHVKSNKKTAVVTEKKKSCEGEKKQEQKQVKEQMMEQKQQKEQICFETKDGKKYTWQHRYDKRLMKLAEKGNAKKMNRYLYRIAKRLGIKNSQEIEEFIKWAMETKPWTEGNVEQ